MSELPSNESTTTTTLRAVDSLVVATVVSIHVIACSHRRRGQDKTRLSCLVRVGGVNKL